MALDPSIILQGRTPDMVARYSQGLATGQQQNQIETQNALAGLYKTQGAGILAGDQGALNALAGIDPNAAMGMQSAQLGMQSTRLGMDAQRQGMAATQQRMDMLTREEKASVAAQAAAMGAAERASAAAEIENAVKMGMTAQSSEQWDALMSQMGAADLVGQFGQRQGLAARYMEIADVFKMVNPEPVDPTKNAPNGYRWITPGDPQSGVELLPGYTPKTGPDGGASEEKIARMGELGIPRSEAIRIVDLTDLSRDPTTGESVLIDLRTGSPFGGRPAQSQAVSTTGEGLSFGSAFPDAASAFGASGAIKGAVNTATDAVGLGAVFPDVMQAQADIDAWAENTRTQMLSSYNGKDSVWLTQQIDKLIPRAGSVFTGVEEAKAKIIANARQMESELRAVEAQIQNGRLKPDDKKELVDKATALRAGVSSSEQLLTAIKGNGGADQDSIDLMNQLLEGE